MADWLPSCKKQDFGTNGGSWARQPAIIVIHSTEGNSWPGYDGGSSAPHFTTDVRTNEKRQHISMGVAARALANPSGGVETNRAGAIQIEVIGTCDPTAHKNHPDWLYLPNMNSAQQTNLRTLIQEICSNKNISFVSTVTFIAYPDSYGSNGVRLSGSSWNGYKGILGHQHVPENDHGDPGNIPIASIMSTGDDFLMALSDAEQKDMKADTNFTKDRVAGFLAQRYYVDTGNQTIKSVPEGTEGAMAAHGLDTLDGNSLQWSIWNVRDQVTALTELVENLQQTVSDLANKK